MPGYICALWVSLDDGLGAVALANATSGVQIGQLVGDLVDIVAEHEPALPRPWRPLSEVDARVLDLAGVWYWGPSGYALRLGVDAQPDLAPLASTGRGTRFRRTGDDTWVGNGGYWDGEILRPVQVAGHLDHLDIGTFVFTREPYDPTAQIPGGVDADGWRGVAE
jgi:hypothetical protein